MFKVFFKIASKSNDVCLVILVTLAWLRYGRVLALAMWGLRARCWCQMDRSSNTALPGQLLDLGHIS